MDINERLDAAAAKMEELRAKIEETNAEVKESFKEGAANFVSDMKFNRDQIEEISEEADRKSQLRLEKKIDRSLEVSDALRESKEEGLAQMKADAADFKANVAEIGDAYDEKMEARLDAAKAKVDAIRDKINDLGQAYARADLEELIVDLITYGDECYEASVYLADEAIAAYKAAAYELALYNEKYGE